MVTAICCSGRLRKSIELVNMNQIDFARLAKSGRKPERDCHWSELHGKKPRPIRIGLIEPGRPRGIQRYLMAMLCQSRAHGLGGLDGTPFDWIKGMDDMK
jgi:hypothetical protein